MKKNNRISKLFNTFVIGLLISVTSFHISAAQLIPFQARLTDGVGAPVADGVYAINFAIYDTATGGTPVNDWVESHSTVSVMSGVVNVILGSITPLDTVTFYTTDGDRFIGITIGTGQEMVPRHQLITSFQAVNADHAANASKLGGNLPSYYSALSQHNTDLQALTTQVNNLVKGLIGAFSGSCPAGWLLADGTSGTPDLRNRFLRGESTANPLSLDFAGNDDAVVVSHTHNGSSSNAGNHTHTFPLVQEGTAGGGRTPQYQGTPIATFDKLSSAGDHTHGITIGSTGVNGAGKNIPQYYEVIYCVKQ